MIDFFAIFDQIAYFIDGIVGFFADLPWPRIIYLLKAVAIVLSLIFTAGIVYSFYNASLILKKRKIGEFLDVWSELPIEKRTTRWAAVKKRMESHNESDWKLAILEADGILDDIMKRIGHEGAGLGERLQKIEPSDFDSLADVWEAHKIRNRIAHEAADFKLSREEAERAIGLFEKGLKELEYLS